MELIDLTQFDWAFIGGVGSLFKSIGKGLGDILTGGAFTARKLAKRARRDEQEAQESLDAIAERERRQRRNIQRAALQDSPSLFDLLRGPTA